MLALAIPAAAQAKTFYWISHGGPADPVWTYFLAGAKQWAADTGNTVNTSFHNGDVASQQEAVRAAIAAKADGITTTSPDPGSLVEIAKEANAAKIPIINFNTPDPTASFDAYVGGDNVTFGKNWAQYLVDKGLVKKGDFVWMPVEIPGATYGVQEEEGIKSVFEPLGITYEVTEATLDQAEAINRMVDYLTANRAKIKAIIGLGDLVTGSVKRVFDQAGVKPGEIPVVGWGNSLDTTQEVLTGYVNAGQWQDPQATSYIALSLATWKPAACPPASTSSPARSTKKTPRRSTTTSCPASKLDRSRHSRRPAPPRMSHCRSQSRNGRQCRARGAFCNRQPRSGSRVENRSIIQRLDREARVRAFRAAHCRDRGLLGHQPRFPLAAEHLQHAGLHGRARPDRARHDAADDIRRIRPVRRLACSASRRC